MLLSLSLLSLFVAASHGGTFTIENDRFVRDGQEYLLFSGCVHYSRVHPAYWADRLTRVRAMGLNAIETYVPWNFHNPAPDVYNFTAGADLAAFLQTAKDHGLLVLLRAGPYMCGEWEFGGLPAFLLNKSPPVTIRTYEAGYIAEVEKWWRVLLAVIKPFLYENGGPIVMMQIENEYGSYGNVAVNPLDRQYMEFLLSLARSLLGDSIILYTTDGGDTGYMSRGTLPGKVFTTGDFGPGSDPSGSFRAQKQFNAPGKSPNMCSEFYTGWLTHWGEGMANTSSADVAHWMEAIIKLNGSFSLYMAHGGSNFGFWSGANGGGGTDYTPHITSYDYDSPISEGGGQGYGSDQANKFTAIQEVLARYPQPFYQPPPPFPPVSAQAYGPIVFSQAANLFDSLGVLSTSTLTQQDNVQPQEKYNQSVGFTLYSTFLPPSSRAQTLDIRQVRDRAQVFLAGQFIDTVYRTSPQTVTLPSGSGGRLDILIENMGRINYGHGMTDPKGIVGDGVFLDGKAVVGNWTVATLPLQPGQLDRLVFRGAAVQQPAFYRSSLLISGAPQDTYIAMRGWGKGAVWVNGFNLGRYWESKGPQHTLYVPAPVLVPGPNVVVVLELEKPAASLTAYAVDAPDFHSGRECVPGPLGPGLPVVMSSLDASLAAAQQWQWSSGGSGGPIQLQSNTSLCVAAGPATDPSTGQPALQLALCGDRHVRSFSWQPSTKEIRSDQGDCVDVTSHEKSDGAGVEMYACNGGDNQMFAVQNNNIISSMTSASGKAFLLTACNVSPDLTQSRALRQMREHSMH